MNMESKERGDDVRPIPHVLLVEDNPADVSMFMRAMPNKKWSEKTHVVGDGAEALEYLKQKGRYRAAPPAQVVVLDLNLPIKTGREVLAEIKKDENLRKIPVIIFTSSEDQDEINTVYGLGANSYICKRAELDEYLTAIRGLQTYWFELSTLPS